MPKLEVLSSGPRTTVQDLGFRGGRAQGVPQGGVLDRDSLFLLNALLGNPEGTAALEMALLPPRLRAVDGPVRVATGGNLTGRVQPPGDAEARPLGPWTATTLAPGDTLLLDPPQGGGTALLGVAGGVALPTILGSHSTFLRAGFGGFEGRVLRKGDMLPVPEAAGDAEDDITFDAPPATGAADDPIRVVPGPQDDQFTAQGMACFLDASFTVTPLSDRMGMRLEGPALEHLPDLGADIVSDGVAPGAIQVPGNGQPIVLLADAQTTGGYAKIATVISADLSRLARLVPGNTLRFAAVTLPEAEALAREHRNRLDAIAAQCVPVSSGSPGHPDLRALYEANLISGTVDTRRADHFPGHLEARGQATGENGCS